MERFLSFNITKLIFIAVFLFALNQNIIKNLWSSIQTGKIEQVSEQIGSMDNSNKLQSNDSGNAGLFGLDIKITKPMVFRIQLGQLQVTLN